MKKESKEIKPCPTQGGEIVGYKIEYQNDDGLWHEIKREHLIPLEAFAEDSKFMDDTILNTMHLYDYSTAMAFMWSLKAKAWKILSLRAVPYLTKYDIKCYKQEHNIIKIDPNTYFTRLKKEEECLKK